MQDKKLNAGVERFILTGMIVSKKYMNEVTQIFDIKKLQSVWSRTIANWCFNYFEKYEDVPKESIEEIFNSEKENLDDTDADLIEKFLESISEEYTRNRFNYQLALDQTEKYFRLRHLEKFKSDLTVHLMNDDIDKAESSIYNYNAPKRTMIDGVNLLSDKEAIDKAFDTEEEELFTLKGSLGEMVGPLIRGDFFSVFGPAGRGKSWWLLHLGLRALQNKLRVLYVSLEMTQNQMERRAYQCFTSQTKKPMNNLIVPVLDCKLNQQGLCKNPNRKGSGKIDLHDHYYDVIINDHYSPEKYYPCSYCRGKTLYEKENVTTWFKLKDKEGIDSSIAKKKADQLLKMFGDLFHLVCYPASSITMKDLSNYIDRLESQGMVFDVIITDYADNFASEYKGEFRHGINDIWLGHRALAQKKHCCVITCSHTNRKTFDRNIKQSDSSEDSRKMNHITKGIALNQTDEDKRKGIMRISNLKKREEGFTVDKEMCVLQQLEIGRPFLNSFNKTWSKQKKEDKK